MLSANDVDIKRLVASSDVVEFELAKGIKVTYFAGEHSQGVAGYLSEAAEATKLSKYLYHVVGIPGRAGLYQMYRLHNVLIEGGGKRIFFLGSTNVPNAHVLPAGPMDVLLLGLANWQNHRPSDPLHFLGKLAPKKIIPFHHESFYTPYRDRCTMTSSSNLPLFLRKKPATVQFLNYGEGITL